MDLASYESVRAWGAQIYHRVAVVKDMPEPPSEPWTDAMRATFKLWMDKAYPRFEDDSYPWSEEGQQP